MADNDAPETFTAEDSDEFPYPVCSQRCERLGHDDARDQDYCGITGQWLSSEDCLCVPWLDAEFKRIREQRDDHRRRLQVRRGNIIRGVNALLEKLEEDDAVA